MVRELRELEVNTFVEIGKFYVYEYKGNLCVGKAIKNPNGVGTAMENLNTGKVEYPYSQQVFVTEEPCNRVILTYRIDEKGI